MGISALYPTIRPSLNLDFANTQVLDPRITFTRATTGTYFGSNGVMKTAAAGAPRFGYDPVTGESLGLLVEAQRTNLLLRSAEIDDAAWTKTRSSATANAVVAPDGTTTADTLVDTVDDDTHLATQACTTTAALHTFSLYAKAAGRTWLALANTTIADTITYFNVGAGSLGTRGAGASGATITAVGNGWYRCTVTMLCTAASNTFAVYTATGDTTNSYVGNGTSGVHLWGAQVEVGSQATSYIPTVASQVTRNADSATLPTGSLSPWYREDDWSAVGTANRREPAGNPLGAWTARTSAANNYWRSVCWSPELGIFCAVEPYSGQVMTSPNGIDWTLRTSAANNEWLSVCWSPELGIFCAVAYTGPVMTSPNGIDWTLRTSAADNGWLSVCWSPELGLFCAVAISGPVMTSPNGIDWTLRTSAADNSWRSVCWAPELGIFCAVAYSGPVMTSPNGIDWTLRTSAADNGWLSVCWSPELGIFCAVAYSGTGNRVMTSQPLNPRYRFRRVRSGATSDGYITGSAGFLGTGLTNTAIGRLAYYPQRLTDPQLDKLTEP